VRQVSVLGNMSPFFHQDNPYHMNSSSCRSAQTRPAVFSVTSSAHPLTIIALLGTLIWGGCSKPPQEPAPASSRSETHLTFDIRGEVVGVDLERRILLVHHEEIPNYMPAMTMEFKIGEADITSFQEGQKLSAKMIDEKNGDFLLEGIRILDTAKDSIVSAAARDLKEDTHIRGKNAFREVGETAPRFALFNQDGAVVNFDQLRGKQVVLNFIFTRCPVATMCPAATERMARLQRLVKERGVSDVHLVSISLDPTYDTPPVLKAYAANRGIETTNFSFLTGPESAVRDLLTQFGVIAERGDNIWKHSLATLLIDRTGKIVHRVDGSTWDPSDFLLRLESSGSQGAVSSQP